MVPPSATNPNALQAQIDNLGETMRQSFNEIKTILQGMDERMRALERSEAGCYPVINQRMDALEKDLTAIQASVKEQGLQIAELTHTNRLLKWGSGIVTAIIVALLIALATGNAAIVFH